MSRMLIALRVAAALFFLYLVTCVRHQVQFEHFLDTLYISFDDFPPDYSQALKTSTAEHTELIYDYPATFNLSDADHIPPIIHFIWFRDLYNSHLDVSEIPHVGSEAPKHCRGHNPGYEINIWNATAARALIEAKYSWFLDTYDGYRHPIQRVDAFKYFVLYHYGGVYMDLDIACRRPLDPLLQFPAWFPEASPLGVNNDLMASRPEHPLIGKMTETLMPRDHDLLFPYLTIFWTTGPQFTSDVLRMWFADGLGKTYTQGTSKIDADRDQYFILPQSFYSEEFTFFGHSAGGTWHGQDVAVVLWLVQRPWVVGLLSAVLLTAAFLLVLKHRSRSKVVKYAKLGDA